MAATRSRYAYAHSDPVNGIDPSGLYDYQYDQLIGTVQSTGGAIAVMSYLKLHFAGVFPFSTGQCATIVDNETCVLQPAPFDLVPSPVVVGNITPCSFSFTSEPGHVAGPGGTITFSTYVESGEVYLRENAQAPNATWWENLVDPIGAWVNWTQLAANLSSALAPTQSCYVTNNPLDVTQKMTCGPAMVG